MKIITFLKRLIFTFVYFLCPVKILIKKSNSMLTKLLGDGYDFVYAFSGRSAIYCIYKAIGATGSRNEVLVPDYICNAVYKAVEKAGLVCKSYKTSENFEPCFDDIKSKINDRTLSVLITSIFGSQGISGDFDFKYFEKRNIYIIFDCCQGLYSHIKEQLSKRSVILTFSGNNKNFYGIMGGVIALSEKYAYLKDFIKIRKTSLREKAAFLTKAFYFIYSDLIYDSKHALKDYEFSYCEFFPYIISNLSVNNISLAFFASGIENLYNAEKNRKERFKNIKDILMKNGIEMIRTEYNEISPYIAFKIKDEGQIKILLRRGFEIKAPYAAPFSGKISLRPDIFCVKNN